MAAVGCGGPQVSCASSPFTAFRYADSKEIATATLRRGCLQPERLRSAEEAADDQAGRKVPNSSSPSACSAQQKQLANGNHVSSPSIMNCFDPLRCSELDGDTSKLVVALPPADAAQTVPDILQQQQQTSAQAQLLPREVLALYAKVEKRPVESTAATNGEEPNRVIVNHLSTFLNDLSSSPRKTHTGEEKALISQRKQQQPASFTTSMDAPIPAVPNASYISVANSNVDQNV